VGIFLNLCLFAGKLFAGTVSSSVAITADAFNNLSDAGSSIITLIGFRMAGQKPDPHHPFGHGRIEHISGLLVAVIILLMGLDHGPGRILISLHAEVPADGSLLELHELIDTIEHELREKLYCITLNTA